MAERVAPDISIARFNLLRARKERYGKPEGIPKAVAFTASTKAQYVTGSTLTVDGDANA
jgi:NAD(P)-dependent dehydrogenase (short-subunit alcohol dehydrogenase family)